MIHRGREYSGEGDNLTLTGNQTICLDDSSMMDGLLLDRSQYSRVESLRIKSKKKNQTNCLLYCFSLFKRKEEDPDSDY